MDTKAFFTSIGNHFGWDNSYWVPFAEEWAKFEGSLAEFNPLATTQPFANTSDFNGAGVKNYASLDDGIQATIQTLDPTSYGGHDYYPTLRRVVQRKLIGELRAPLALEIQTWGTFGFASEISAGWEPTIEIPLSPVPTEAPVIDYTLQPTLDNPALTLQSVYDYVNALNSAVIKLLATLSKEPALTGTYKPE